MAQHDMNIANQGFPATRADINNALNAIATNNSGTSEPSTTFANQWFYNTNTNKLFIRNEANNAFIEVATLDQTNNEWQITTGTIQAKDSDGLALKTDDGNTRIFINDSDGNVGIGTTDVNGGRLVVGDAVSGDTSLIQLLRTGVTERTNFIGLSDSDALVISADENNEGADSNIRFKVDGSEVMQINANGLDLGTTTDAASVSTTSSDYQLQLGAAQSTTGDIGRNISFDLSGTTTAAINSVDDGTSNAQALAFFTGTGSGISEALRINKDQKVGIGTTSPSGTAHISSTETSQLILTNTDGGATTPARLVLQKDGGSPADNDVLGQIDFNGEDDAGTDTVYARIRGVSEDVTGGTEDGSLSFWTRTANSLSQKAVITEEGKVGIGTSDPQANLHIQQTTDTATIRLHRTGSTNAVNAALGAIEFFNNDGSNDGSNVTVKIAGTTHNTNGSGGRLAFFVHDGLETGGEGSSPVERVRISGTGVTVFDQDAEYSGVGAVSGHNTDDHQHVVVSGSGFIIINRFGNTPLYLNRMSNDGVLVNLYAQGNVEGTISVSGSTVSYNGGHLSRYSQLADNTKDTSIVKGTVMTNLDQMAVWTHAAKKVGDDILDVDGNVIGQETEAQDARTELNEQLNCMAVSSVEGDPNVAGVFVNWDEDDDVFTNDMNVAMTGDMVIRIAQGTTVARGDLLMSAGDGTAKPQDDDIVRSKTIAKVTSTNVSHTYDDGSYLVPCVLMAC